jgi:hypothetical protein
MSTSYIEYEALRCSSRRIDIAYFREFSIQTGVHPMRFREDKCFLHPKNIEPDFKVPSRLGARFQSDAAIKVASLANKYPLGRHVIELNDTQKMIASRYIELTQCMALVLR